MKIVKLLSSAFSVFSGARILSKHAKSGVPLLIARAILQLVFALVTLAVVITDAEERAEEEEKARKLAEADGKIRTETVRVARA